MGILCSKRVYFYPLECDELKLFWIFLCNQIKSNLIRLKRMDLITFCALGVVRGAFIKMNVKKLEKKLISEKIKPIIYNFTGKWENDELCLVNRNGKWETYYSERGNQYGLKIFSKEQEACEYFYDWIWKDSAVQEDTGKWLESFQEGQFQIFDDYKSSVILFDTQKRRVLGENCKYVFKNNNLYVKEKNGYIVINVLKETIKQLQNISENKFVWGGEYGEEYKKINKFEEFSEEEKIVLRDLK